MFSYIISNTELYLFVNTSLLSFSLALQLYLVPGAKGLFWNKGWLHVLRSPAYQQVRTHFSPATFVRFKLCIESTRPPTRVAWLHFNRERCWLQASDRLELGKTILEFAMDFFD